MSVTSVLDLTGRHEGMGVSIWAEDDSSAAAIQQRSTGRGHLVPRNRTVVVPAIGRASTSHDYAIARSNSSVRQNVWGPRALPVACSQWNSPADPNEPRTPAPCD